MTVVSSPQSNRPAGRLTTTEPAELVAEILAGSEGAEAELFRRHHEQQRRVARRVGLAEYQVDDCVSMAWAKAMQGLAGLRQPRLFRTWLLAITRNVAVGIHRRGAREQLWGDIEELPGGLASGDEGAEAAAVRREEYRILLAALSDLDERDRTVVELLFVERRPYDEVAGILDCAMGSIGPTRGRVIRRLRRAYHARAAAA